ncbi:hypothetical protein NM688_g5049 [Phlebia brevispora]|uniref:Uncharacterized protein n=1 Tax=Phlebia brevispora TaxID=194682 RepID=A0ACC1T1C2_9APHY|nr:hypothetical protein NM688_g5049 [Phlebia brevispora]
MSDWDLLSSYAGLLTLATFSVYTGSFGSLPPPKRKVAKGAESVPLDEEDEEEPPERLSSEDAWLFPIIGSAVLFGLYLVVKYFGKEWINWLLRWYFTLAGIGSGSKAELLSISLRSPSLFLIPLGAVPSILYTFGGTESRKSALLTDILALSFSFNALSLLTVDSFKTGCILLSGLFLYDIWWVFGTEVMVKVATTLDVPIKLLWTKSLVFSTDRGFTMLGLGDIVVPGMFVALALRYDHYRALQNDFKAGFKKPYFYAAVIAYASGLGTTMAVCALDLVQRDDV